MIQKVQVVRGKIGWHAHLAEFLGLFLGAWFVMLLVPVAVDGWFTTSYWQTVAIIIISNALFKSRNWTVVE